MISGHAADAVAAQPVRPPSGRYEFLEVLGEGAMGIVYRARDLELHRTVAVKTIARDDATQGFDVSAVTQRLYQEATAAARLTHPGIVTIYDVDVCAGVPYVVMEYVKGRTLADLIAAGPPPPDKVVHIVVQACRALQYAHGEGVVHRDVKSSNIMVDDAWHVKLTDFGVARVVGTQSAQPGVMVGTPAYMSPEQVRGVEADARSDLFSLGVVLYEALVGERPFPGEDLAQVLDDVLHLEPLPARERNVAVSPALDAVVKRAMSKDPDDRYPDAGAFADALTRALAVRDRRGPAAVLQQGIQAARRHGTALGMTVLGATALAILPFIVAPVWQAAPRERQPHRQTVDAVRPVAPSAAPAGSGAAPVVVGVAGDEPGTATSTGSIAATNYRPGEVAVNRVAASSPAQGVDKFGCVSVNAVPFATVHVDGRHVGDTPRACLRIGTGRHRLYFESMNDRSPERLIVVLEEHTRDNPLGMSYDFRTHRFLAR